jgi:hypothetical protein
VAVGEALRTSKAHGRVMVVGSGGLSHWPGTAEHGRVNEQFDREFLRHFAADDLSWLSGLTTRDLFDNAGNGGQELRNWLALRGCLRGQAAEIDFYEPIPGWLVGWAVATMTAPAVKAPADATSGRSHG